MFTYASTHACEQIVVRYGIAPTRYEWIEAFLAVTEGRSLLAARDRNCEVHYVPISGVWVRVVYSPITATFVTALPFNSRRKNPPRHLSRDRCEALHT
jgi:hypothetical protein